MFGRKGGLQKHKVDEVIEESHREGFFDGLGGFRSALQYSSTSRFAAYNGVHRIAYDAGQRMAKEVLEAYEERKKKKAAGQRHFGLGFEYKIPGSVYAECYGEAKIACVR